MSTSPSKETESNRSATAGLDRVSAAWAYDLRIGEAVPPLEAADESQALFTMSLCGAGLGRSLRSRRGSSRLREVRRRKQREHQSLPTQGPQEATMPNSPQYLWNGAAKRCAICDGRFGLVRHYSWRTAFCSRKCADRFKTRQEDDLRWLRRPHAA
jgi:hypothetical protein